MTFIDHLLTIAEIWCRATGRSLSALGNAVANDGKFFGRLERGTYPTVATFEKFLSFFRDGANWPDGRIPQPAGDLLDNFSNIATAAPESPGTAADCAAPASGAAQEAA